MDQATHQSTKHQLTKYRQPTILLLLLSLLVAACTGVMTPAAPAVETTEAAPAEVTAEVPEEVEEEAEAVEETEGETTEAEDIEPEGADVAATTVATTTDVVTGTDAITDTNAVTGTEPVTDSAAVTETGAITDSALLTWEGEIDGACYTLTIQENGEAAVGSCGDAPSSTTTLDAESGEWAEIRQHFGTIDAETPAGQITFQGQGRAASDIWAHALATWASFTAMEFNAGRTSAAARTILAWQITDTAEHSGQCSHLVVLAYGYAYANQIPCEGDGPTTQVTAGWLSETELDTLYDWVANGERVEEEAGYLDAQGSEPISPDEVSTWAGAVYTRLLQ